MTTTHTPGPWKIVQESIDPEWHVVTAVGGRIMANVHIESGNPQDAANARLIAAAPDLLAMLDRLALSFDACLRSPTKAAIWREVAETNRKFARAAIAHATGATTP